MLKNKYLDFEGLFFFIIIFLFRCKGFMFGLFWVLEHAFSNQESHVSEGEKIFPRK